MTGVRVRHRGFTLAETLVAIAVLAALVGSVFGFMRGLADRRDSLERLTEDAAAGDSLLRNIEADIASCVAGAAGLGAGVAGDAQSLRLLSRAGLIDPGSGGAELVRAEYTFDAAAGAVTVSRRGGRAGGGGSEVISRRAQLLRFRYLSGGAWQERFDSAEEGGLPVAIEVAIWFGEAAPAAAEPAGTVEEFGAAQGEPPEADTALEQAPAPRGEPDRVRMFIVPDGPTGSWEGGA